MKNGAQSFPGAGSELAFPAEEYKSRLAKVRESMAERRIEVLLVHHPLNVLYLTGFQSINMYDSECVIVPTSGDIALVVPERELGGALLHTWVKAVEPFSRTEYPDITFRQPMERLVKLLGERRLESSRIGIEKRSLAMPAQKYETLVSLLPKAAIVDGSGTVEAAKATKSPREIACLKRAAGMSTLAMEAAIGAAAEGKTDNDMAAAAYQAMIGAGSEYPSLGVIVNSGFRSGIIHATHKRIPLKKGEGACIELGGCFQRYTAPCMRTVSIGEPGREVAKLADACLTALNNVLATMGPGVVADDVARAGREGIARAGEDVIFHGCFGYSVGGAFPPTWADGTVSIFEGMKFRLQSGMAFHIPMGLRLLGRFGAMASETAVITDTGCEVLTSVGRRIFVK